MKRNRKRTLGMAMVEMIFVLPLLILLVFAIAEFGLMFSRWLTLSNAVREGARAGVAWRGASCDPTTVQDDVQKTAGAYARSGGVPLVDTASYFFKLNIPYGSLSSVPLSYKSSMRNEGF
jgi:hypothetical protein